MDDPPPQDTSCPPRTAPPNPFIAFRHQIDASISSLLRSLTGLPSQPPSSQDLSAQAAHALPEAYQPHELESRYPERDWVRAWTELVTGEGDQERGTTGKSRWGEGGCQRWRTRDNNDEGDRRENEAEGLERELQKLAGSMEELLAELPWPFGEAFKTGRPGEARPDLGGHGEPFVGPVASQQDESPETELDVYRQLLLQQQQSSAAETSNQPSKMGERDSQTQKPGVIATLTTTQRTVEADGTVRTRVVLKNRFADGREESCETTHQSLNGAITPASTPASVAVNTVTDNQQVKGTSGGQGEGKKGGWFWS
ncbi:MAG: hypothetical protein M1814_004237 [Vezdaea aestivalis]|nr:MAG: hypothetical protein M1814_004237 [Vezdaea aestivalis]